MRKSWLFALLTGFLLLLAACDGGGGESQTWASVQTDDEGNEVAYEVTLTEMFDGCYEMTWDIDGDKIYSGYGLSYGEDMLAVGYAPATLKHYVGAYRMTDTGLAGVWSNGFDYGIEMMGEGVEPPEVIAWDLARNIDFAGENPDGSGYSGYLGVAVFGGDIERGVQFTQHTDAESYMGRVLYFGDSLVAIYSLGLDLTVQFYERGDDEWSGLWYVEGAYGLGSESLYFNGLPEDIQH